MYIFSAIMSVNANLAQQVSLPTTKKIMLCNALLTFGLIVASLSNVSAGSGVYGWDTSQIKDQAVIDCFAATNDANFIVFTAMTFNDVDPDVCNELDMAKKSNIPNRDVRFTPCPTCGASAEDQFNRMLKNLNTNCADSWSGRVWLDMKNYSVWPTPWRPIGYESNQKFFNDVVDACQQTKGVICGMLSSPSTWKNILGSESYTYAPATTMPLWYSSLNNVTSFDDFVPFGGYTQPYAKQYVYMLNACGGSVVYEDWAPKW